MARWRLMSKHYINVPGTEWEYKEMNQATGRQARKVFEVPLLLDPDYPGDCNYPGEIIVCNTPDPAFPRDYHFLGAPTPEMEAIDDSAKAISEKESVNWKHPIDSLPTAGGYTQSLLAGLEKQLAAAIAQNPIPTHSVSGVSKEEFETLKAQMADLLAQNAALQAKAEGGRRTP